MRERNKQQGKKKPKLQPKAKVKYRNFKSNYSRLEDDDLDLNFKQQRKQRFNDEDNLEGDSSKPSKNRQRSQIDFGFEDDDDFEY